MRIILLAVLIYSTAVSSTYFGDSEVTNNNLSVLNDVETLLQIKAEDFSKELLPSLDFDEDPQLPQCMLCKTAFRVVKKLVSKHASNDKVKRAMNRACNKLGKASNKCHSFVNKHGDGVIRFVRNPRVLCSMLGMCFPIGDESTESELNEEQVQADENSEEVQLIDQENMYKKGVPKCSICKTAMKALLKIVHHGGKDEIKKALGQVCHKLGKLRPHCEEMVNNHSDQIVDLVTKHTPPKLICKAIGMCKSAAEEDFEIEEILPEEQNNHLTIDVEISASPKCFVCKQVMNAMKHMIQHHGDRGSIQRAMQKVCSKVGKLSGKCNRFVQRHGNKIVDLLTNRTPLQRICKMIGVCKTSDSLEDFDTEMSMPVEQDQFDDFKSNNPICAYWNQFVTENDQPISPQSGPFCVICELLVAKFKASLDTKSKRDGILHMFLFTCDVLPDFIRKPCHNIVQGYGAAVLHLISTVQPHDVCQILQTSANQTVLEDFDKAFSEYVDTNCDLSTA